jgi:hypothetical protein
LSSRDTIDHVSAVVAELTEGSPPTVVGTQRSSR